MRTIDETHAPELTSWVEEADSHPDFPIQNLPLGVFSHLGGAARGGIAIGEMILDLAALAQSGLLSGDAQDAAKAASGPTLAPLLEMGRLPRRALRRAVSALLKTGAPEQERVDMMLVPMSEAQMLCPAHVGNYTDFYVGIHHAEGVGALLRPDQPLLPNYRHIPIGYHGRASTVRPSGTPLVRPHGQCLPPGSDTPYFAPTQKLDFELELGLWMARGNPLGRPIPLADAFEHMAGITLLNDWSARDVQAFEYRPLGPFQSKSFLTSVSPWLVTVEALAPFRQAQAERAFEEPRIPAYLFDEGDQANGALSLTLSASLASEAMRAAGIAPVTLGSAGASDMYWTLGQMVAHHTANGCALETGDLLGTGTISGRTPDSKGSLMEIAGNGAHPITLPTGESRSFLEDGDEVILSGHLHAEGWRSIGMGVCRGTVMPPVMRC